MIVSKSGNNPRALTVDGQMIERVRIYKYLKTIVYENWDYRGEVRCPIEKTRKSFMNIQKIFVSRSNINSWNKNAELLYIFCPVLLSKNLSYKQRNDQQTERFRDVHI